MLERSAGRTLPDSCVIHVPLDAPSSPGRLDPANARYVLAVLDLLQRNGVRKVGLLARASQ